MTPELRYFRDQAVVQRVDVNLTNITVRVLLADPMRYAIVVPNDVALDLYLNFDILGPNTQEQMRVPPGNGPVVLTEDTLGELVRRELWVTNFSGSPIAATFTTVSYCTYRYEQMRNYVNARLSQFISL